MLSITCIWAYCMCVRRKEDRYGISACFAMCCYMPFLTCAVLFSILVARDSNKDTGECDYAATPIVTLAFSYALALLIGCVYFLLFLFEFLKWLNS